MTTLPPLTVDAVLQLMQATFSLYRAGGLTRRELEATLTEIRQRADAAGLGDALVVRLTATSVLTLSPVPRRTDS